MILALVVAASGAESPPRQRTWFERMMHPATSHPGESMGVDEIRLLRVLSDGKKRTYVHLTKEFGIPMTHHAPLWASELARRPLQLGFIRRRFGGYYEITPEGMAYLRGSR